MEPQGDYRIVDIEPDGVLIFEAENGVRYESGETAEQFGYENMTAEERRIIAAALADIEE